MKKLISLLLVFVTLLSLCACHNEPALESDPAGTTEATQAGTEETLPFWQEMLSDPNAIDYDSIDENVPENGEYQIHTAEGMKNIAQYPDAKFKILRDIDMGGMEWTPVENFTGTINGQTFKIKNFTISKTDASGNMAFIGVNEGVVNNVVFENVTITSDENTKNIAGLVAVNKGIMRRNDVNGTITIEKAADGFNCGGSVAINENVLETESGEMHIISTTTGKGNIGGMVGIQKGGKLNFCTAEGNIEITNGENKTVGLLCAQASDVDMADNAYGGVSRLMDGKVLESIFGVQENVTNTGWAARDYVEPLSKNIAEKRQLIVDTINEMGSIRWTVNEVLTQQSTCTCCSPRQFFPGIDYRGIPYVHRNGSLNRFKEFLDENNVVTEEPYTMQTADGWETYVGNDCTTAVQQALAVVCNDANLVRSRKQFPAFERSGSIAVGDWVWDLPESDIKKNSGAYITATGEEEMLECYAKVRYGDNMGQADGGGGHSRLVTKDPVVMRDENGKIDPVRSYFTVTEQRAGTYTLTDEEGKTYVSSWWVNVTYTFRELLDTYYVPLTWEELITDEPMVTMEAAVEQAGEGQLGLHYGIVKSNVYLDAVIMKITDSQGNEVFNHKMWVNADHIGEGMSEERTIRWMPKEYDLAHFSTPLKNVVFDQNETYNVTILAENLLGQQVVAREFSF